MSELATNREYYKRGNYVQRKFAKISRKLKSRAHALSSDDYSSKKIDIDWGNKPSRFDLINLLIEKNNYQSYLEIGCSKDECFKAIKTPNKIGVDPFRGGTHRMTSDAFFEENTETFDIIFVDGLHQYDQVLRDMINSVEALNDGGVVLVHDCLPRNYYAQLDFPSGGDWNGDVWKAFAEMRAKTDIDCALCLIDHGVGIIKKRPAPNPLKLDVENFIDLKYKDLVDNYQEWLNAKSYGETLDFLEIQD